MIIKPIDYVFFLKGSNEENLIAIVFIKSIFCMYVKDAAIIIKNISIIMLSKESNHQKLRKIISIKMKNFKGYSILKYFLT